MTENATNITNTDENPVILEETHLNVYGAKVHNLKNIDISIPRNKLVVFTGISGSGKSSLAFDTIYAEGQRRYMEAFSAYARQFMGDMERPEVDKITGLSPVISIEQKTTNKNPRSTVGTITEVYDFLRLLYARIGEAYSYASGKKMVRYTEPQVIDHILEQFAKKRIMVLAPVVRGRKGHYRELFEQVRKQGYLKVRIDGEMEEVVPKMQVDRYSTHDIEVVIDRLRVNKADDLRLRNALTTAFKMGRDLLMIQDYETEEVFTFSKKLMDPTSGVSYEEPSPNSFSFNSPYGACGTCNGLGVVHEISMDAVMPDKEQAIGEGGIAPLGESRDNYIYKQVKSIATKAGFSMKTKVKDIPEEALNMIIYGSPDGVFKEEYLPSDADKKWYGLEYGGIVNMVKRSYENTSSDAVRRWAESFMESVDCPVCHSARLKKESLHFKIGEKNISQLANMDLTSLANWFEQIEEKLNTRQLTIAKDIIKEIRLRIRFLLDVGLSYLSLNRPSRSLSGGEAQRIRLATQIGSKLTGITYILDEPTIGLHQRDNDRLITALKELTEADNTVIVVEHDEDLMHAADYIIDLGPGAGEHGGEIVAEGDIDTFLNGGSLTADYLSGKKTIAIPAERRTGNGDWLRLFGATGNNLTGVDLHIPLGAFTCVTGVSGSGKSTLINETLYPILRQYFYNSRKNPMPYREIEGIKQLDKVIEIDQSPIGRTPRSNPATYIKVFDEIRKLFAITPEAKMRGYKPGRFSFNVKGGRCETCQGAGLRTIEMNFLPDVYVQCDDCQGKRYNRETLDIVYKGKTIYDVLEMTVEDAVEFFQPVPKIYTKLKMLNEVGLGYIRLGQSSVTLSGGEAQRVKISLELSKRDTGRTFYILDEPTTGLHFEDIRVLLDVLQQLIDRGNTVVVIEHNLDVVRTADYIIDLGPEGGNGGGHIIAEGTPEEVARVKKSITAKYLQDLIK